MSDLGPEEENVLKLLLLMTGREERLSRVPLVEKTQIAGIRAIWPHLKSATEQGLDDQARSELLNRLLLSLGIKPVSVNFVKTVFHEVTFADLSHLDERVCQFRTLCMLEFGSFRFGYKRLRQSADVQERWKFHFPTPTEASERAQRLRSHPQPVGLSHVAPSQLFALGYLASEHAVKINGARKKLLSVVQKGIDRRATGFEDLQTIATDLDIGQLIALFAQSGIPGTESLVYPDLPLFGEGRPYTEILATVRENCITVDEDAIKHAQLLGLQNARTYMSMGDLDVYMATSMREPLHFTSNWAFVRRLFHHGVLADWHLRYFDPTQAFLQDRIQKGLLECLMIKRSRLCIYNAQESDTFGKDSEAAVALAQRKAVVVYVARLFEYLAELKDLYAIIDSAAREGRDHFLDTLAQKGILRSPALDELRAPEKTKADAIERILSERARECIPSLGTEKISAELMRQGYDPEPRIAQIAEYAIERIVRLEKRALTFRGVHPLALQTAPSDGVARGVIVTRTVQDTASVVRGLLLGNLPYEIVEDEANWLLVDTITRSPVRVVTKDPVLTSAFWSEHWGECEECRRRTERS